MTTVDVPSDTLKVKAKNGGLASLMEKTREKYMEEPALGLSIYIAVENIITCNRSVTIAIEWTRICYKDTTILKTRQTDSVPE